MQMDIFAQEAFAHLPHKPWLFYFQRLGAQKQRVNRRIRMPAIFQKLKVSHYEQWAGRTKENKGGKVKKN